MPRAASYLGTANHEDHIMASTKSVRLVAIAVAAAVGILALTVPTGKGADPADKVKVTIQDEKPVIVEAALPVDPTPRVRYTASGLGAQIRTEQNQQLHLSHFSMLNI